ncbi:MAG TPA: hypothetical protein VM934_11130 [Pyrinomonadaceae bacterium]|nr:hypothetical protein [Pyrinomonadaceae bacterium]
MSSSTGQDQVRSLAERIARRLASASQGQTEALGEGRTGAGGDDLGALRAGLDEIQRRLAHVEAHIAHDDSCAQESKDDTSNRQTGGATKGEQNGRTSSAPVTHTPWLSGTYVPATSHPSQERFGGVGDAVVELVEHFEREKTCSMEPGGKPCDQCGMCSARGF